MHPPATGSTPTTSKSSRVASSIARPSTSRKSDLHEVARDDNLTLELGAGGIDPHLLRDERVVRGHKVRENERLHARLGRHAPAILGGGVAVDEMLLQR